MIAQCKMRHVPILVLASVVLSTGFILPRGKREAKEVIAQDSLIKTRSNDSKEDHGTDKFVTLENNQNKLKNKEALYELGKDKENIINERSFIFLNQKYKKPYHHQVYVPQHHFDIFDRSLKEIETIQHFGAFSRSDFDPSFKLHPHLVSKDEPPSSDYAPPYQYNLDDKGEVNKQFVDEPREYLELLKPPLLRTINSVNDYKRRAGQTTTDAKDNSDYQYIPLSTVPWHILMKNKGFKKPYLMSHPILEEDMDVSRSQSVDGFNDPDAPGDLSHISENNNVLDSQSNDLFTRYTESATTMRTEHCHHQSCNFQLEKKASKKMESRKPECLCSRKKSQHDHAANDLPAQRLDTRRDRLQREKTQLKANTPLLIDTTSIKPASLELPSYDDDNITISTENPYRNKSEDDVLTAVNKLEDVLHE